MAELPDLIRDGLLSLHERADQESRDAFLRTVFAQELIPLLLAMHGRLQDVEARLPIPYTLTIQGSNEVALGRVSRAIARVSGHVEAAKAAESAAVHVHAPEAGPNTEPPALHTYAGGAWVIQELARLPLVWDTDTGYTIGADALEQLARIRRYALRWTSKSAEAGLPPEVQPEG